MELINITETFPDQTVKTLITGEPNIVKEVRGLSVSSTDTPCRLTLTHNDIPLMTLPKENQWLINLRGCPIYINNGDVLKAQLLTAPDIFPVTLRVTGLSAQSADFEMTAVFDTDRYVLSFVDPVSTAPLDFHLSFVSPKRFLAGYKVEILGVLYDLRGYQLDIPLPIGIFEVGEVVQLRVLDGVAYY